MSSNPYAVLGLEEDLKLSIKEVHDAYHALAREYHPDKNLQAPHEATAKFQAIQAAYTAILKESTLGDEDGEASKKTASAKLAKPWAPKRGRKFNHRAMQEVEDLKEKAAKAAAERAHNEAVEQEQAQRPKGKKRAKQWEKDQRKAEIAIAREKETARRLETRLAQKAGALKLQERLNITHNGSETDPGIQPGIIQLHEQSLILSSAAPQASYLNQRKEAIIEEPQVGRNKPKIIDQIRAEKIAMIDSENLQSEEAEDLEFEIPQEFQHTSTDAHPENDPQLFIERYYTPDFPSFPELFCEKFPRLTSLVEEAGGDFQKILDRITQENIDRQTERENKRVQEEEANERKVAAFEKYWASRKGVESPPRASMVPPSDQDQGRKVADVADGRARDYNRKHLANLASQPGDDSESPILIVQQEILSPTRWSRDHSGSDTEVHDDEIEEDNAEYLWEKETSSQFQRHHDEVEQVQQAFGARRSEAVIAALEYQSGLLLEDDSLAT
ncbi:hypothetical protein BP6252_00029 [Coleophoma cylindrospora]|uniref:J domain-containing protein n=1 Tax=Coleophoma cylindrospora TaxID=1849047 RepID=A0A3D8SNX2_9HELO|nr:hypothetical protein BP6252_00029 [Coleophoma cylindrospora]